MGSECPTFSWAAAHGSTAYVLVVYEVSGVADGARVTSSKPLLEVELPDGALSWTPSLGECLPGAGRYSWAVGARGEDGEIRWSVPVIFRVIAPLEPREEEPRHFAPPVDAWLPGSRLLQSLSDEAFSPPACNVDFFDVTVGPLCGWVKQFSADQIVTECAAGRYCPDNPVTRAQFALFAQRIMRGTNTWRPEAGDGSAPNLTPAPTMLTPLDTPGLVGLHTSVTIGADGLGLISYHDATDDGNPGTVDGKLKVAHCSDVNCTAATVTPLDTTGLVGVNSNTSITIGADGRGLISYYDITNGDLKVAHCSNVNCTDATITALDTAGNAGQWSSITIGADGRGLIAYYDVSNGDGGDLKVAHCSDVNCTSATFTVLDASAVEAVNVGRFPSIAIGADGLGLISYFDVTTFDLKVAHCADVECTSTTVPATTLDQTGFVGVYTSIAIGRDGLGLISYYDSFPASDLKVAHCSDLACTTATKTAIDTPGDVGQYSSIAIGADGLGIISYREASPNFNLKVAHCSNVSCAEAAIATVDATPVDVGWYTSITIAADGLPLISYQDATDDNLKVVHCSNVLCVPYFRRR